MKGADIFQEEEVFAEVLTLMKSPRVPSHPHCLILLAGDLCMEFL